MKASVVVCTFNRAALLSDTLIALSNQQIPPEEYEIIVVDNNSSDHTRIVTERLAAESRAPIRYVFEKNQGLSFARNTGIRAANGQILAFVDDDVDVERGWLCALISPFGDPLVACAGGPIRPVWPFPKPAWLTKEWEGYLGISEFETARDSGVFRWPTYPWGCNIAFRRDTFDIVGLFPIDLGRIGKGLLANEELSVCRRIEAAGYSIRLAPNAVMYHKIFPEQLKKQAFYHRAYYQGRSDAILDQRSAKDQYARLRNFASAMFWARTQPSGDLFDKKCRERLFMGYFSQSAGMHHRANGSSEYRNLRALKVFVSTILDKSGKQIAEQEQHLHRLESLVRERDRWLAERDQAVAEREQHLHRLESLIRERDRWLAERDRGAAQLTADRDNWRQLAQERQESLDTQATAIEQLTHLAQHAREADAAIDALEKKLWIRIGRRFGLLNGLQEKEE